MSLLVLSLALSAVAQGPSSSPPSGQQTARGEQGPSRVIRHIPVREWMATSNEFAPPPLGSFLEQQKKMPFLLDGAEEVRRLMNSSAMLELVRLFTPTDLDADDVTLQSQGATLLAAGPPDKVHLVETTVRQLTRAMIHHIRLRAELYRVGELRDFPAVATADQLAEVTRGLERVWSAVATCASGNSTALAVERSTEYVLDVNVEVAQSSKIGDPRTAALFEGVRVIIEPHALAGSRDLVLYSQFGFGEQRRPMELRDTGISDMPSLDVPSLDSCSGTASGRVENGGALLTSIQGDRAGGGKMLLVLSASQEDRAEEAIGIYPVSALLSGSLRDTVLYKPRRKETGDSAFAVEEGDQRNLGPYGAQEMLGLVRDATGGDRDNIRLHGGHLVVRGSEALRKATATIVEGLQDLWLRTARIDSRTTLQQAHHGPGVFRTGPASSGARQHEPLHRVTFPALLGRPHVLVRGHETTCIRDVDVEIAQKSATSNPVVDDVFTGLVTSVYVYPQQLGTGAEVTLSLQHSPELVRRPQETRDGGDLYLPSILGSQFSHRGPIPVGQDVLLGDGPTVRIGDQSFRTQQHIRVSLR